MDEARSDKADEQQDLACGAVNFVAADKVSSGEAQRKVGRYQLRELLGLGGMGQVYAAYDPMLKREVALKLLNKLDPLLLMRFLQEAQFQARLTHPAVCRVFEVDAVGEIPFIAMERIHGKDLLHAEPMPLTDKLKVMIQIADAVQSAHALGLIHRDLKPSNILLEKDGPTGWRPRVLDFGLARDLGAAGLTMGSCLMGTPPYMAPEQYFSHDATFKSDIYALGATFFAFLTGKPPAEVPTAGDMLERHLPKAPLPLRKVDPAFPVAMEVILQKCMAEDPVKRYESADALAQDLRRLLEGNPISAKPPGVHVKVLKTLRSHGITLLTVATLVLASFAAWGLLEGTFLRRRLVVYQGFEQELREIEAIVKHARTAPIHDTREELASVQRKLTTMEGRLHGVNNANQGPGLFAIGYGYLLARDYENAKKHLTMAWDVGERHGRVACALGRCLASLYLHKRSVGRFNNTEAELALLNKEYRDPAKQYLTLGKGALGDSPHYSLALLAICEGRFEEALNLAKRAQQEMPWDYEMQMLEARVRMAGMRDQRDLAVIRPLAQVVDEVLEKAAAYGRSDEQVYVLQVQNLNLLTRREIESQKSNTFTKESFHRISQAVDKARLVNPDDAELASSYVDTVAYFGHYYAWLGKDPMDEVYKAQKMAKDFMDANRGDYDWPYSLAKLKNVEAVYYYFEGSDPEKMFELIDEAKGLLQKAKQDVDVTYTLVEVMCLEGDYLLNHRKDAKKCIDSMIALSQELVQKKPDDAYYWAMLGLNFIYHMRQAVNQDKPLDSPAALATTALERAVRIMPSSAGARIYFLDVYTMQKNDKKTREMVLPKAFSELSVLGAMMPLDFDYLIMFAKTYGMKAESLIDQGKDPGKYLQDAHGACLSGISTYPELSSWFFLEQAKLYLVSAKWAGRSKQNVASWTLKAKKSLDSACSKRQTWASYFQDEYRRAASKL